MGVSCAALGHVRKSLEFYQRGIGENPNMPAVWHNMGELYGILGDRTKAMECMKKYAALSASVMYPFAL
jgi:tetratricopeptide (TPR) repeat protein